MNQIVGWTLLIGLRALALLPAPLIALVLWPWVALHAAVALAAERRNGLWERIPADWLRSRQGWAGAWRWYRERIALEMTLMLFFIADRLLQPRWRSRWRRTGWEPFERAREAGRPVLIASLHFGPGFVLRHWLLASGVPAGSIINTFSRGRTRARLHLDWLCHRTGGLEDGATRTFLPEESREACEFLQAGNVLLVGVDGSEGAQLDAAGKSIRLRMAKGPIRIARIVDAEVFPLLLVADGCLRFKAHLGTPVPRELIRDRHRHAEACEHLVRQFEPILRAHAAQCWSTLLKAIDRPPVPQEAPA